MYVNEPNPLSPVEQRSYQDKLVEAFSELEEFPVTTSGDLDALCKSYSQKIVYRSLVEVCGRRRVIQELGSVLGSEEVVRMQVSILCREYE